MNSITYIGIAAACCTTLSFVPQVIHILRSGKTDGISLGMYSLFTLGVSLWFIYGIIRDDMPVYTANGVTLVLTLAVLGLTLKERLKGHNRPANTPD
jgi:MtN3 and saliva related transmembrane protein